MKKLTSITALIVATLLFVQKSGITQCTVKIIGIPQTGNPLKAKVLSGGSLQVLSWQLNGQTVMNYYRADFIKKAVTVAGGKGFGSDANQLAGPSDVYVDAENNIYVLDGYNNRVQKWAPGSETGETVAGGNGIGTAANQFFLPQGFFVDASKNIYVADVYNNRIQKWTPGAATGITVAGGNGYGSALNQLNAPHDVFMDGSGNLYVADGDNNRIQKWAPGATSGVTVAGGNGYGFAANQLNSPYCVNVDGNGSLYISDRANDRIQKWNAGSSSGLTVAGGSDGVDSTQLNDPRGIFVSSDGIVYVADYFNNRIQKWVPGLGYGITVAGSLIPGKTATKLSSPSGLFISAAGDLYVADEGNNRVQKFQVANTMNMKFVPKEPGTYRVIAVFANGCRDTSNEIVVTPPVSETVIAAKTAKAMGAKTSLTPNPAHDYSIITFNSKSSCNYTVEITDMTGRIIKQLNTVANDGNNQLKIDLSNYVSGFYLISLKTKGEAVQTVKLYKN